MKTEIFDLVSREFESANERYPFFSSTHEGYAVVKEELDEFWDEVKKSKKTRTLTPEMKSELIQIMAMCLKTIASFEHER